MDYSGSENATRTNAEQSKTAADFRVSYESEWADLEPREKERLPYHEHQLQPNEDYRGYLDLWDVDEARVIFEELTDRFHLYDWRGIPLPPTKLPGFANKLISEHDPAAKLIEIGVRYAIAVIKSQPRAMHLRWAEAEDFIREIRKQSEIELIKEQVAQQMRDDERRQASPVFVYFIGSEAGPIKIGMATRPQDRLKGLQTSHHEKLEILATCDGGAKQERAYHKMFAHRRLNGEWFERCPEIEEEIARLQSE